MACYKCKKPARISLGHFPGKLCDSCFPKLIEKRVRKVIRTKKLFSKADKVMILDDGSKEVKVIQYLIQSIVPYLKLDISVQKINDRFMASIAKRGYKVILPWNLDNEVEYFFSMLFTKMDFKKTKTIKLLRNVSQEEIEIFASIKKIKGKTTKPYNKEINAMLNNLEKDHPDIKFSILKSSDAIFSKLTK